ncbi:DUF4259 domain-containing protein [Plantactinospora sp. KLBMP9567]|uniref:DUF4259 domain-containing protein n=1 Tax=Plantactinospora sp. KLBMP9567 TaxID=3085900 RepID=UPI0029816301|nr:DUF4259 domain-containing protein [Plantactinospora sp. KLBMP9567]MDW5326775.1 DUF4259 domain-containing protein [Plantactinospora sp. KLBMP9567]
MSASDVGPFDNDFALDFCDEVRGLDGDQVVDLLRSALNAAADAPEGSYIQRDVGEAAVAAAAIVVAKRWERTDILEEVELESSIPQVPTDLLPLVVAALERVRQPDSEVRRLWAQVGAGDEWSQAVEAISIDALRSE